MYVFALRRDDTQSFHFLSYLLYILDNRINNFSMTRLLVQRVEYTQFSIQFDILIWFLLK